MKIKIVDVNEKNFDKIPRPANQRFSCKECFYWVGKKDGRSDLERQKKNWFSKKSRRYGSLGKILLLGGKEVPVGFIQFGPLAELRTTRLIYNGRFSTPKNGWCIACIAVQADYRGKGLANVLVDNVVKDLKKRGVKVVDAYPVTKSRSWNQISMGPVRLWKKCGFEEIAKISHQKGQPALCQGEMVLMRKKW